MSWVPSGFTIPVPTSSDDCLCGAQYIETPEGELVCNTCGIVNQSVGLVDYTTAGRIMLNDNGGVENNHDHYGVAGGVLSTEIAGGGMLSRVNRYSASGNTADAAPVRRLGTHPRSIPSVHHQHCTTNLIYYCR